jgi:hypothetical protein
MNKIEYYQLAAEQLHRQTPWSEGLELLEDLYNKTYVKRNEFVPAIIDQLIEYGYINESADKITISPEGQELIELAAELWIKGENIDLNIKQRGTVKRKINDEMLEMVSRTFAMLENNIDTKPDYTEDRSNLFVHFTKRLKGIASIEIRNADLLRISIRKPEEGQVEYFKAIGMVVHKVTPTVTYMDLPRTMENLEILVNAVIKYIKA